MDAVYDSTNNPQGFKDNANASPSDDLEYDYDLNGNLILDTNKGITAIKYNHFNLPTEIIFNNNLNTKINYFYNAIGQKVKKIVKDNATTIMVDYLDGFQYQASNLKFFPTSEGYVSVTTINNENKYNYVYNYLDHLGNIRLSYGKDPVTQNLKILEENHYYPYGLKHTKYNSNLNIYGKASNSDEVVLKGPIYEGGGTVLASNPYKFNGCELQTELNLNLYDMDMRDYDPAIGRWLGNDPVTHFSQSPYNAFDCNPVLIADPSGADGEVINTWHYSGASSANAFLTSGAGNLGSGDHMFGTSGDAFWIAQTGFSGEKAKTERVWVGGNSIDTNDGNASENLLDSIVIYGHWETVTTISGWDIANGFAGSYLSALDSYASANATKIYNYGSRGLNVAEVAENNFFRMQRISRVSQGIGGTLAIGTGIYGLNNEYESYRNTGTYNGQAVVDSSISIAGGVSGSLLLAAEVGLLILSPALVPVLTVVAVGATAYGVYTLGRDIYNANH